jgi:hypothetical protein
MAQFRMPSLGADMDAGTVVEWLVKPGDAVRKGIGTRTPAGVALRPPAGG